MTINQFPRKIVATCLEDPLDAAVTECPKCDSDDVDQLHHQANWLAPECWYWACNDCEHTWGYE